MVTWYWSHWHTCRGGWTDVRIDIHDVMAIKPNFLTLMGYHIFLAMVLRARITFLSNLRSLTLLYHVFTTNTGWSVKRICKENLSSVSLQF